MQRREAQKAVILHRNKCIDILNQHKINLRGVAVEPENLSRILEQITVYEPRKAPSKELAEVVSLKGDYMSMIYRTPKVMAAIKKAGGAKVVKLFSDVNREYQRRYEDDIISESKTAAARKEFTTEFDKFAAAKTAYLDAKVVIEDTNEYINIVEKIGNIANNKKGSK